MKLTKIFALLICLTMAITCVAGLTAFAATDVGTPEFYITYAGYDSEYGDHMVTVHYRGLKNLRSFETISRKEYVTGISAYSFVLAADYDSQWSFSEATGTNFATNVKNNGGAAAFTTKQTFSTKAEETCGTFYFTAPEDEKITFSFSSAAMGMSDIVASVNTDLGFSNVRGNINMTSLTINDEPVVDPAKDEEFDVPTVTAPEVGTLGEGENAIDVTDAAKQIAVFGKNPATKDLAAGTYGITVGGIRYAGLADVATGSNWAVKLIAPAGVTLDGNAFVGTYEVNTYVDGATGTAVQVTVE